MKDKDLLYLGLGAGALYLVYRVSNSKTGAALDDMGSTWAEILNPETEFGWGKDFAKWLGFDDEKPIKQIPNWSRSEAGVITKSQTMPAANVYKGNLESNRQGRQIYAGDLTDNEVKDWEKAGWVRSGASMVAPSLVAEQKARLTAGHVAAVAAPLGVSKYTGNPITSKISVGSTKSRYSAVKESNASSAQNRAISAAFNKMAASKRK